MGKLEIKVLLDFIFQERDLPRDLMEMYPLPENTTDLRPWVSWITSDFVMKCPGRNASSIFSEAGLPAYRYLFNHVWSIPSAWGPNYPFCGDAVCHGAELPFVFDSASVSGYNFTAAERALSRAMAYYWGNFAKTGVPGGPNLPSWCAFIFF